MMKKVKPEVILVNLNNPEDQKINLNEGINELPKTYLEERMLDNIELYYPEAFINPLDNNRIQDLAFYLAIGVTYQSAKLLLSAYRVPNDPYSIALALSKYYGVNVVKEVDDLKEKILMLMKNGFSINEIEENVYYLSRGFLEARSKIDTVFNCPIHFNENKNI